MSGSWLQRRVQTHKIGATKLWVLRWNRSLQSYRLPASSSGKPSFCRIKNAAFGLKQSFLQEYIQVHNAFCYICRKNPPNLFHGAPWRGRGRNAQKLRATPFMMSPALMREPHTNHPAPPCCFTPRFQMSCTEWTHWLWFQKVRKLPKMMKAQKTSLESFSTCCSLHIVTVINASARCSEPTLFF